MLSQNLQWLQARDVEGLRVAREEDPCPNGSFSHQPYETYHRGFTGEAGKAHQWQTSGYNHEGKRHQLHFQALRLPEKEAAAFSGSSGQGPHKGDLLWPNSTHEGFYQLRVELHHCGLAD